MSALDLREGASARLAALADVETDMIRARRAVVSCGIAVTRYHLLDRFA